MLVISRKPGESFVVGNDIKISILEINGEKIKIGIDAQKKIRVMRSEVLDTEKSNIEAVLSEGPSDLQIIKQKIGYVAKTLK